MSFLLEVSAVFGDAQQLLLAHPILAATLTSIIAIPLLFFLFTMDRSPNAPPQMSILLPALMGKFKLAQNGPLEMIRQGYKKYGDIFRVQLAHRHVTFLVGPEAQTLFFEKSDDKNLTQKEVYEFTVPVFGRGIIYDADPNVMLQQLKFVKHGLAGDSMRAHCDKVVAETIDYFNKWQNQGTVNFKQAFAELTILTASRCLLGAEVREHLHTDVAKHYETLEEGMRHITFFAPNFPVSFHRRRNEARAAMAKIFGEVIQKRRLAQAQGAPKQEDFLQHLIDARYRNDQQLTDDEITGLLLAGLFAGQHTSSITSTWMGINILSKKDKLVPRLLEEQRRVLAETGGKLTLDALNKMDLLHACMKETLRMYPPLIMLMRYSQFPQDYKGYTIPKGEILIVSPSVAGRLESVWTNPDEFDPDRFSPERNEGAEKNAYIAFGSGRHACLGEKFGYLQVKTIWSTLLRQFDFEATGPVPPIDYTSLVAAPTATDGVVFNFKRKKDAF